MYLGILGVLIILCFFGYVVFSEFYMSNTQKLVIRDSDEEIETESRNIKVSEGFETSNDNKTHEKQRDDDENELHNSHTGHENDNSLRQRRTNQNVSPDS